MSILSSISCFIFSTLAPAFTFTATAEYACEDIDGSDTTSVSTFSFDCKPV